MTRKGAPSIGTPTGRCLSCGADPVEVESVIRVYLDLGDGGFIEHGSEPWCAACRANYPHLPTPPASTPPAS